MRQKQPPETNQRSAFSEIPKESTADLQQMITDSKNKKLANVSDFRLAAILPSRIASFDPRFIPRNPR
jgi:hypothetical protein